MVYSIAIFFCLGRIPLKVTVKKTTAKRIGAVLLLFAIFSTYLLYNIFRLDFINYAYYQDKTYDQVTTSSVLRAKRGNIYDANMNILATSNTTWRIFISTKDIKTAQKNSSTDYAELIASGLSDILSIDKNSLLDKIKGSSVLDVTLKKSASEEEYNKTLNFVSENGLERLVFTEANTSRYYPMNTLAAHVLGFTGSDNQGLYGLEYYYDDILAGEDGYYVYAKDASGNALDTEYSSYFPATDGYSIVTTIDSYLQSQLESILETVRVNNSVSNRVTGVVMDVSTGAVLAMATSSPFNPNEPFVLDSVSEEKLSASGYAEGSEEYKKYKNELMQIMWSNKAVSETYEPGSTFKIVTVSAALESGVAKTSDTFSCPGYCQIGGYRIRCHKTTGHGSGFNLAYGLQMSCNPCMIALSQRLGAETFYSYVEKFGYLEKTGIDLPSEASTIFHDEEALGVTELATASFGQRFKVSVINHITAIAAVANGGKLVTPYVVSKIIDSDGNIVSEHETEIRRVVISEEVAESVSKILIDGVSGDGGAKNAAVAGYDIAAKTGTSQKFDILDSNGNSYLRISSTVAYAVDESSGIAVIIVADEPNSQIKYGSVVAAPYVSQYLTEALPYLEYKSTLESESVGVDNYVGMNINSATQKLQEKSLEYEIIGDGEVVLAQTPTPSLTPDYGISKVILYTAKSAIEYASVPKLTELSPLNATKAAINAGFNIKFIGASTDGLGENDKIISQSIAPGEAAIRGSTIVVRVISLTFED